MKKFFSQTSFIQRFLAGNPPPPKNNENHLKFKLTLKTVGS